MVTATMSTVTETNQTHDTSVASDRPATQGSFVKSRDSSTEWLTAVYGLGILLVVAGHAIPSGRFTGGNFAASPLKVGYDWIYSFHMPLFFTLAGITYRLSAMRHPGRTWPSYVRDRAARLLVPYLIWNTVAFPAKVMMIRYSPHKLERVTPLGFSLVDYADSLLIPWHCAATFLWFLPTLFLLSATVSIVAPWVFPSPGEESLSAAGTRRRDQSARRWTLAGLIGLGAAALCVLIPHRDAKQPDAWLNYPGALHYAFYFWSGVILAEVGAISGWGQQSRVVRMTVAGSIAAVHAIALYWVRSNGLIEEGLAQLGLAVLGIAMALTAGSCIAELPSLMARSVQGLGQRCMAIYLLSWFVQIPTLVVLAAFLKLPPAVCALGSLLTGVLIPFAVATWCERHPIQWWAICGLAPAPRR